MKATFIYITALLLLLSSPLGAQTASWNERVQHALQELCDTDPFLHTTQLGLYVYDLTTDTPLFSHHADHRMRPASCQKLVTAITALNHLGTDYEVQTRLFVTGHVEGSTLQGDVYVVGGMDPLLEEAHLQHLTTALRQQGIDSIGGRLCIDPSRKDTLQYGWGWCWDDEDGPLTALLIDAKASAELALLRQFANAGIALSQPRVESQPCPPEAVGITVLSHSLPQLLQPMMKESDNMVAECLFYQLAFSSGTLWAGRKEALLPIKALLQSLGIASDTYTVADGSGLSLYNYLTPNVLVRLLRYAWTHPSLYEALQASLPIAGKDGTLKNRLQGTPAQGNVRAKTGTVTGVSSLAGYITTPQGHQLAFCIINQGAARAKTAREFQDKVCLLLCGK